jgi:hypothetical protein
MVSMEYTQPTADQHPGPDAARAVTTRVPSWAELDAATAATAAAIADPSATVQDVLKAAEAEEALFLAADAARWRIPDQQPGRAGPGEWVTEVSVPRFGDNGVQRLHSPTKQPEPEAGPEAEI